MTNSERLEDTITEIARQMGSRTTPLSRTKLVKLLYFVDLEAWDELGHAITGVEWRWNHYGPYSAAIVHACQRMHDAEELEIAQSENPFGAPTYLIRSSRPAYFRAPSRDVTNTVRRVVSRLGDLSPTAIGDLSYDTAPMRDLIAQGGERGDLVEFAATPPTAAKVDAALKIYSGVTTGTDGDEAAEGLEDDMVSLRPARRTANSHTI